jgi:hypothetical protein
LCHRWEYTHLLLRNLWPCVQWQGVLLQVANQRQICKNISSKRKSQENHYMLANIRKSYHQ